MKRPDRRSGRFSSMPAELMSGEQPFTDPTAFRAGRY